MSHIFINVDVLAGTDIATAIGESMTISNLLAITLLLTFNERKVYISPGDTYNEIYARWSRELCPKL